MELDERDRKREKEELEEIRQRLLAEGHPDPDAELQRVGHSCCLQHILHTSSVEMRRLTCTGKLLFLSGSRAACPPDSEFSCLPV